jgi:hypothetical protein
MKVHFDQEIANEICQLKEITSIYELNLGVKIWRISSHVLLSNQKFYGIIDWETTSSSWLTGASAK